MQRAQKLLGVIALAIPLWYVGKKLNSVSPDCVRVLAALVGLNAVTVWMLRYQRDHLTWATKVPGLRNYLNLVCRLTGEQLPVGSARRDAHEGLALKTLSDFDSAATEAEGWVRGQRPAIDKYMNHVRDIATLRQRLEVQSDQRPLASFLLVGDAGVGKRYFSQVLGRLIFLQGADQVWELDKLGGDQVTALLGARGSIGPLLTSLSRQPYQTIVFENVQAATPALQAVFRTIMQKGIVLDPATGRSVSFQNAILVFTTTGCVDELSQLDVAQLTPEEWHAQSADILTAGSGLTADFIACVSETIVFSRPSDMTKAEVIALVMCRECSKYGVRLEYVDPEILVQEVEQVRDDQGFSLVEERTKKLLQAPLLEAARRQKRRLLLRAELIATDVA